ncbi:MAG: molybdate ABC transporter permease subunit [Gammaproteobacteria bacterium]|nr:molybdate ABC transporter permease subunit [Gammaproteobacteria bacterium]MCP4089972.1 molybdate ABC transporter permease subunit [Gammaproteobacteria bacterium]MCP4276303.1 molybdate ABC transporter permease subunit [Gammaproteobacteria bacterium]MCP4831298.1 molybdate ABC transporter permease subunit [Gammaproteobacteria bacterium]MCP4928781.1 molybdate ABC transporter permease subunit [Gammaproteobacteria bacterium]
MLNPDDITALWITLKLASITTLLLLVAGTPLAWWLSRTQSALKPVIDAVITLPLILPPTVLGFYLLIALGPDGPIGSLAASAGGQSLAFSFTGLVIGSVIYSLPFVIRPLEDAFTAIGKRPLEVAATLGAGPADRFFSIALPLARPGYLTALVLGFAHTLGEFGVVLMIGGNIPGKTQVLSIAIYDHVETLEYSQAHLLSGLLLCLSFFLLLGVFTFNRRLRILRT